MRFRLPLNARPGRKNASCLSHTIYFLALEDAVFEVLAAAVDVLVVDCSLVLRRGARHQLENNRTFRKTNKISPMCIYSTRSIYLSAGDPDQFDFF